MPSGDSAESISPHSSSSPAAARDPARRRADRRPWPLLAALALLASVAAAATGALAYAWSPFDPLNDPGPALLAGHFAAFMAATFVLHAGLAMLPVAAFALLTSLHAVEATVCPDICSDHAPILARLRWSE